MKRFAILAALLILGACGGGTSATTTVSSPQTSAAPATSTGSSSEPPTTSPSSTVPAGVQYDAKPVTPTAGDGPTDANSTIDPKTLPAPGQSAPAGYPIKTAQFLGNATVASTATNKVAVVTRGFNITQRGIVATEQAVVWHSTDGVRWQWIDLRPVIGDVASKLSVAAVADGFVAFGEVLPLNDPQRGLAGGVVLLSPDGVTWTRTGTLTRPFAVHPTHLEVVGSSLLLVGEEYICDSSVGDFAGAAHNQQTRYWRSGDQGRTWTEVPIASIAAIKDPPVPSDNAECASADSGNPNLYFSKEPTSVIIDGRISLFSFDGGSIATSTDLTTWSTVVLPDAIPSDPNALEIPLVEGLVKSGGNILALTLTHRYDAPTQASFLTGYVVNAWTSTDGTTFVKLPPGRPLDIDSDLPTSDGPLGFRIGGGAFRAVGDGVELDVGPGIDVVSTASFVPRVGYSSVAGPLEDWQHCVVKAAAFCRFADIGSPSLVGADLTGIDLAHAQLGTTDFSGADLTDANLSFAVGKQVKLANAKLVNARANGANLIAVDFSGADLTGAKLDGAFLDASVFKATIVGTSFTHASITVSSPGLIGAKFNGLDLTAVNFYGATDLVPMTGADFVGATLASASFNKVDLTGAIFTGDDLTTVRFTDVTCPDGQKSDSSQVGAAACRL